MSETEAQAHAVKFVGPDTIEGPVFLYSADLDGERFTPDTDLCIDWFGKSGRPLLYEHGLDDALKAGPVGRQVDFDSRDEGIWAMHELERGARFRKGIDALIEQGALSYSGGAMQHLAVKSALDGAIKRFPWVETSLTPTPANPANAGVYYLKSADAIAHLAASSIELPAPLKVALGALDEWAESRAPVPERLADRLDRVSDELEGLRLHAREVKAMRLTEGRELSAATRERLLRHPASLRDLAADLEALAADVKSFDLGAEQIAFERAVARLHGVVVSQGDPT